jgi:hypothetical protein
VSLLLIDPRKLKPNAAAAYASLLEEIASTTQATCLKTSDLTTAKCLMNSVISTPGAKFMGIDLKDFYLNHPLPRKEYVRIPSISSPKFDHRITTYAAYVRNGFAPF